MELYFEHGHDQQLVLSEEQSMLERPGAEKKEGRARRTKKREIKMDGDGGGGGQTLPGVFPETSRGCALSKVTNSKTKSHGLGSWSGRGSPSPIHHFLLTLKPG